MFASVVLCNSLQQEHLHVFGSFSAGQESNFANLSRELHLPIVG